jgi:hypothetical protein
MMPWDDLSDAQLALDHAKRFGTDDEKAEALRKYDEARDRLYLVAACIFSAAVGGYGGADGITPIAGYVTTDVWKVMAARLGVPLEKHMIRQYHEIAQRVTVDFADRLQAAESRVRELEAKVGRAAANGNGTHQQTRARV